MVARKQKRFFWSTITTDQRTETNLDSHDREPSFTASTAFLVPLFFGRAAHQVEWLKMCSLDHDNGSQQPQPIHAWRVAIIEVTVIIVMIELVTVVVIEVRINVKFLVKIMGVVIMDKAVAVASWSS